MCYQYKIFRILLCRHNTLSIMDKIVRINGYIFVISIANLFFVSSLYGNTSIHHNNEYYTKRIGKIVFRLYNFRIYF